MDKNELNKKNQIHNAIRQFSIKKILGLNEKDLTDFGVTSNLALIRYLSEQQIELLLQSEIDPKSHPLKLYCYQNLMDLPQFNQLSLRCLLTILPNVLNYTLSAKRFLCHLVAMGQTNKAEEFHLKIIKSLINESQVSSESAQIFDHFITILVSIDRDSYEKANKNDLDVHADPKRRRINQSQLTKGVTATTYTHKCLCQQFLDTISKEIQNLSDPLEQINLLKIHNLLNKKCYQEFLLSIENQLQNKQSNKEEYENRRTNHEIVMVEEAVTENEMEKEKEKEQEQGKIVVYKFIRQRFFQKSHPHLHRMLLETYLVNSYLSCELIDDNSAIDLFKSLTSGELKIIILNCDPQIFRSTKFFEPRFNLHTSLLLTTYLRNILYEVNKKYKTKEEKKKSLQKVFLNKKRIWTKLIYSALLLPSPEKQKFFSISKLHL